MQEMQELGFDPWVRKFPWRRKWQPTPLFLPGKFHGQRGLEVCRPWGHEESDTTVHACHLLYKVCIYIYMYIYIYIYNIYIYIHIIFKWLLSQFFSHTGKFHDLFS